jgi:hypothetical protein
MRGEHRDSPLMNQNACSDYAARDGWSTQFSSDNLNGFFRFLSVL